MNYYNRRVNNFTVFVKQGNKCSDKITTSNYYVQKKENCVM